MRKDPRFWFAPYVKWLLLFVFVSVLLKILKIIN